MTTTPTRKGLLDDAFSKALADAVSLDRNGQLPEDPDGFFGDTALTNEALVTECRNAYNSNKAVFDRAIRNALSYLETPEGAAKARALQGALESGDESMYSMNMAADMEQSMATTATTSELQGYWGQGIGVSAGFSLFAGVSVGADGVFGIEDATEAVSRKWGVVTLKGGLSVNAGLELSFWINKPFTGAIGGTFLDLILMEGAGFIRFMYIMQKQVGETKASLSAVSFQLPLGVGIPLRFIKKGKDKIMGVFAGKQNAFDKVRQATMTAVNSATNVSTIGVSETATIAVNIKNTSGDTIQLDAGTTLVTNMPNYFTNDNVSAMQIDPVPSGWAFSFGESSTGTPTLVLTASSNISWAAGSSIGYNITNAQSSESPPQSQASLPGTVLVTITNADTSKTPIILSNRFDLVWESSEVSFTWSITVPDGYVLVDGGQTSGTVPQAFADSGSNMVPLTSIQSTSDSSVTWQGCYIFDYNTNSGTAIPQVSAAWWNGGPVPSGPRNPPNNYVSNPAAFEEGQTTQVYLYDVQNSSTPLMQITLTSNPTSGS